MIIHVKFTKEDESIIIKDFYNWHEFSKYLDKHHGEYIEVSARKENNIE